MSAESTKKTIMVALGVCLVCSVLVSTAAVELEPIQTENKRLDKIQNILLAGDLTDESKDPMVIYNERIESVIVELAEGRVLNESDYNELINPEAFDIKTVAEDLKFGEAIDAAKDVARIKRKPKFMVVYEVKGEEEKVEKFIMPIYGKGLWSTLYGFIAIGTDLKTIEGLTFYEHGETPGLGGEVDNPRWKASWKGKQAFNKAGEVIIEVIKGRVDMSSEKANHQIDGLSGSTLTTRGVDNLVKFWLSEEGYGPFIQKLRERSADEEV